MTRRDPQPARPASRAPRQERSQRTRERLLAAAEDLIARQGLADTSIPEIARHAGSSVGGLYGRFADRDALLRALEERFFERVWKRVEALADPKRWRAASLRSIVEQAVGLLVDVARRERNLLAAFVSRAAADDRARADAMRFRRDVSERVTVLMMGRRDEMRHPDPFMAIDLAIQVAFSLMIQHVLIGEVRAGGRSLDSVEIENELTEMFMAYLGVRSPHDSSSPLGDDVR